MEARGVTDGERKTITALFADIKGSMDLIEDLDPEEARRIVDPALQFMMDVDLRRVGTAHLNVRAQGAHPIPADLHIPPTVHAVLASRIDRLPPEAKELLQILSVIGKELSLSLLKQVVNKPEEELYGLLSHLQAAEFIYEQPAFPEVEYTFKHALTQEVAYNSLLIERRSELHECTARAIEVLLHSRLEDHYSELAHHYSRSGNTQKAVEYLQRAGQQAAQRSANAEAIGHLSAALELLKTLPDTPERTQQELTLQITLGVPLLITKGHAAPEVGTAYTWARELCRQVGETPQLFPVLRGLWFFYLLRAELWTARELGEQLLSLAQSVQDPALLLEAHRVLGATLFWLGELPPAREHFEQGIALYDPRQHRSHTFLYGQDPGATHRIYAACALWHLGYPDQALERIHDALTLAQELAHPYSLVFALTFAAMCHQFRRERHLTQERAEVAMTLSTAQGFAQMLAHETILRGWALAGQGQEEEGIAQIRQGLVAWRATGAQLERPHFFALLADTYGKVGQIEEGLALLAEALAVVDTTGERLYEAELYRLKGELLRMGERKKGGKGEEISPSPTPPFSPSSPEACFHKAIEMLVGRARSRWSGERR